MTEQGERSIDERKVPAWGQSLAQLLDASSSRYVVKSKPRHRLDVSQAMADHHLDGLKERNWTRTVDKGLVRALIKTTDPLARGWTERVGRWYSEDARRATAIIPHPVGA